MIAVVGGTGRLGRLVVTRLLADGERVRVLARDARSADELRALGAELVDADVRDAAGLAGSLRGVGSIVSAMHGVDPAKSGSPHTVDWLGNRNLVDAATAEGADVVLVSLAAAGPDSPLEIGRAKWRAEEYLRAAGIGWTVVRATAFAELWAAILAGTADGAGRVRVFGRGTNPINFVSVVDVAMTVVRAVGDRSLRGQVITVAGPENLSFDEFAARVCHCPRPRHVPRGGLRAMAVLARPVRPGLARSAHLSLAMDTSDMTADPAPGHAAYPWMPCTPVG